MNPGVQMAERMEAFANEMVDPMVCRQPAYGAPGYAHCAACCYGTLLVITCEEEQAIADAAAALNKAADLIRKAELQGVTWRS